MSKGTPDGHALLLSPLMAPRRQAELPDRHAFAAFAQRREGALRLDGRSRIRGTVDSGKRWKNAQVGGHIGSPSLVCYARMRPCGLSFLFSSPSRRTPTAVPLLRYWAGRAEGSEVES